VALEQNLKHGLVTGPHEPLIGKIRNRFLMEFLIRIPRDRMNLQWVKTTLYDTMLQLKQERAFKQVVVVFDVDPV